MAIAAENFLKNAEATHAKKDFWRDNENRNGKNEHLEPEDIPLVIVSELPVPIATIAGVFFALAEE